jgi:hypothetical protein
MSPPSSAHQPLLVCGGERQAAGSRDSDQAISKEDGVAAHGGIAYNRDAPDGPRAAYLDALTNDGGQRKKS